MPRQAIIFDFGNVIAFFDFRKATAKLGARLGLSGQELYDRLGPIGFPEVLREYETGQVSSVEFIERVSTLIQLAITHNEFIAAWTDIFTPNESIIPVVKSLKAQGYRLILGSNTNEIHATHFRVQFASTLGHFDALILSHETKHMKPNPEFYLACARAAGVDPVDCVFIDDLPGNIQGARTAGLFGILYDSTEKLITDLDKIGISTKSSISV